MKLAHFFIDRPIFASVLSIIIVVGGLVALTKLPIAQFPDVTPPSIEAGPPLASLLPIWSNVVAGTAASADTIPASAVPDGPVAVFFPPPASRMTTSPPTTMTTTATAPSASRRRFRRSARSCAARIAATLARA